MSKASRWPARVALLISIAMFGAVIGAFDAFGMPVGLAPMAQQTSASPSASGSKSPSASPTTSSTPCRFSPAPAPVCPASPKPSSASPSSTASPTGSPGGISAETHDSTVGIAYRNGRFVGGVRSDSKCTSGRKVLVRKVRQGPDLLVGRDTTNRRGRYVVADANASGRYYSKVLKRVHTVLDTAVTCRSDRSKTIRVS